MTKNGSVKRGILEFDEHKKLKALVESKLEWRGDDIYACPLEGGEMKEIPHDSLVSMNMFAFSLDVLDLIGEHFVEFMEANKNELGSCEYLIPSLISELVEKGDVTCEVLSTTAVWYGVTYREDKPEVVASLAKLVEKGEYPSDRFGKL